MSATVRGEGAGVAPQGQYPRTPPPLRRAQAHSASGLGVPVTLPSLAPSQPWGRLGTLEASPECKAPELEVFSGGTVGQSLQR